MRCFRKSTRSFAKGLAVPAIGLALAPQARAALLVEPCLPGVNQAIVVALKSRMLGAIEFGLTDMSCALDGSAAGILIATPAPGARVGRPIRFAIVRQSGRDNALKVRVGEAFATVKAVGAAVRVTRDVPRASILGAHDVEQTKTSLDDLPLRRVLTVSDVVGASVARPLHAGQIVDAASIVPVPAIRAGDRVRAVIRTAAVEVEAIVVAAESGAIDEVIRVVNPETKRAMRARVRSKDEVEVLDGR
jgi:flagella basal body P-ring formation protein FlgA